MDKYSFYNSTLNPKNEPYCKSHCLGNGVFNSSKSFDGKENKINLILNLIINFSYSQGISIFTSQPHFLNADEKFLSSVIGLNPDHEKHSSFISFEPVNIQLNTLSY